MQLLTCSALERVRACPGSLSLPAYGSTSAAAEAGIARHAILEVCATQGLGEGLAASVGDDAALGLVEDVTALLRERWGIEWDPVSMSAEASCALDLVDGEVRELGRHRAYGATYPRVEVAGTWDLLVRRSAGGPLLIDWKGPHAEVSPAAVNLQLRGLAVMATEMLRVDCIEVAIVRLGSGPPRVDAHVMDALELHDAEVEMRAIHSAAMQPDAPVRQGEHCRYCPSFAACPAKTQLVRALASSPAEVVRVGGELTPEQAGKALRMWRAATDVLARIGGELHAYATRTPIPLAPGVEWGPVVTMREEIDGAAALAVVAGLYGAEVAEAACERTATKASIERALKPAIRAAGGKFAPAMRETIEAIRAAGGVSQKARTVFEAHPAQQLATTTTTTGDSK